MHIIPFLNHLHYTWNVMWFSICTFLLYLNLFLMQFDRNGKNSSESIWLSLSPSFSISVFMPSFTFCNYLLHNCVRDPVEKRETLFDYPHFMLKCQTQSLYVVQCVNDFCTHRFQLFTFVVVRSIHSKIHLKTVENLRSAHQCRGPLIMTILYFHINWIGMEMATK